jgi:hypothetical protein
MRIKKVQSSHDLNAFVKLPYIIYKDDPIWVTPLRSKSKALFEPTKNPYLDDCDYALFLLEKKGKIIGRIAAFINKQAIKHWGEQIGLFGYFECINNQDGANLLLNAAQDWLTKKGMQSMRGPLTFNSQERGMVCEGFTPSPCIMSPYNPPFYNDLIVGFGLKKTKDLLVYNMDAKTGYKIPDRILKLTDMVAKRYKITTRHMDINNIEAEVGKIIELSNASIADNWGSIPTSTDEVVTMAKELKPILNPKGLIFARDENGQAIGFGIVVPDINVILKGMNGRLFPFGWAKFLFKLPRLKKYRMFALGVIPAYQGKAVDSLIYRALNKALYHPKASMEINYVLEDNAPMNNAIIKLGAKQSRRYRVYQKDI